MSEDDSQAAAAETGAAPKTRKIGRGRRKHAESENFDAQEAGADGLEEGRAKPFSIESLFKYCLFFGIISAIAGIVVQGQIGRSITLASPVLATLSYPLIGIALNFHKQAASRERFGDNCYYLGFIFTQGGLLFAFLPTTFSGVPITGADIIGFFGMAIGAAFVGLIARTIIIQSGTSIADLDDSVHAEVEELAKTIKRQSTTVVGQFAAIVDQVGEVPSKFADRLELQFGEVDQVLDRLKSALLDTVQAYETSRSAIKAATEGTVEENKASIQHLEEAVKDSAAAIRLLGIEMNSQTKVGIDAVRDSADSLMGSLLAFERLGDLGEKLPEIESEVRKLRTASEQARQAAVELSEGLRGAIDRISASIADAVEAGTAKIEQASSKGASDLSSRVDTSLETLEQTTTQSAEEMRNAANLSVTKIAEEAQQMRTELTAATDTLASVLASFNDRLEAISSGSHKTTDG